MKDGELKHKPYIKTEAKIPEMTIRALFLGAILGILFAASSVYLALKVGMTVSASIPIAVLSITIFRAFGKATILENNIVQTTGSAGESIAAGVAFTLPALLLLGYDLEITRVLLISLLGGTLGVLMMIPLREGLIVREHGHLAYPEGTACADVLIVGEKGGSDAKTVFMGFGIGALYKFLNAGARLWKEIPEKALSFYHGGTISGEFSPELLGVGYIIGIKVAATMMAGGVLSYLVLIPAITFFGEHLKEPLFPALGLINQMAPSDIRNAYVLYIGAGAVATGGIISLIRSIPTIFSAFKSGFKTFLDSWKDRSENEITPRTERDLPIWVVIGGSLLLILAIWLNPWLHINFLSSILIVIFGFFFVTVSSRITGEIGSSSNPISGMTVATLLLTCLIFLFIDWTGPEYRGLALSVAAIVCIAASNGGTTSQDLKTGFLVGSTPSLQQISILIGVITSALVIGYTVIFLNLAYTTKVPRSFPGYIAKHIEDKIEKGPDGKPYRICFVSDPGEGVPSGKYLVNEKREIVYQLDHGIAGTSPKIYETCNLKTEEVITPSEHTEMGPDRKYYRIFNLEEGKGGLPKGSYLISDSGQILFKAKEITKLDAPKARLFSLIIDGILTRKLPWSLVLLGIFLALVMELCGVSSLPFAVGVYLPLSTSTPIFVGGILRYYVDKKSNSNSGEAEFSPGVLLSSGYIAGGALCGLLVAVLTATGFDSTIDLSSKFFLSDSNIFSCIPFIILGGILYYTGFKAKKSLQEK